MIALPPIASVFRGALVASALGVAACLDHAPAGSESSLQAARLTLDVRASRLGTPSAITIGASYARETARVALPVSPDSVPVAAGETTVPLEVDIASCLREVAGPGCPLRIELTLLDETGATLDARNITPAAAVQPGAIVDLGSVGIGGVDSVDVSPAADTILPMDSATLVATPRTSTGTPLQRPVTFTTSDPAVAVVTSGGVVTAVGIGSATVSATADGRIGRATITVRSWTETEAAVLRSDALAQIQAATTSFSGSGRGFEGTVALAGLLADEFRSGDTFPTRNEVDQRNISAANTMVNTAYSSLHRAHIVAQIAVAASSLLLATAADSAAAHLSISSMYLLQGYAELTIAEQFCAGTAFTRIDPSTARAFFDAAETTDETMARAEASFTMAIAHALAGSGALTLNSGLLGRARARLGRDDMAGAMADASQVPSAFTAAFFHRASLPLAIWELNNVRRGYPVANVDGGVGLDFVAAGDPRVPAQAGGISFDGVTPFALQLRFQSADSPVLVASGMEALLIVAEGRLRVNDQAGALAAMNAARVPWGLPPLSGPATVDLLFRERAFSLWGTGTRLGDLRRLVRRYGRTAAQVFPSGAYHKGGVYGADVNLPISSAGDGNPNYRGCLDRNP